MDTRRIGVAGAAGLLVSVLMATGCSSPGHDSVAPVVDRPVAPVVDRSVAPSDTESRNIVQVLDSQASLKEDYATIRELAGSKNLVAIVRGTVSSTQDIYIERFAYRILSVSVTETLWGQAGKQITVLEDGGVVPYAQFLPDIPNKIGAPAPSSTPDGYVDFRFMGARHSATGDEVVLFLGVNLNKGTPIDTDYYIVSSVHGRFTFDAKANEFVRGLGSSIDKDSLPGSMKSADLATLKRDIAAGSR